MVHLVYYLTDLLFFYIPLLYYHINLKPSIVFSRFSGDVCLSLGISLSSPIFFSSFVTVSELFFGVVIETFVILSIVLVQIKSPVASTVF